MLNLQFLARATTCKYRYALHEFELLIGSTLSRITYARMDEKSWSLASLSICFGRLGIRRAVEVSEPTFISSFHDKSSFVDVPTSRVNG